MTSILGTQSIQHPNGTSAMTVAADGLVSFGNVKSGNTPCFSATFSSPLNSPSCKIDLVLTQMVTKLHNIYVYIYTYGGCVIQYLNNHHIIMIYLKFKFWILLGGRIGL